MSDIKGLEWTFDTNASLYEKIRPGYADELYRAIFNAISINELSNVVEVGIGISLDTGGNWLYKSFLYAKKRRSVCKVCQSSISRKRQSCPCVRA